MTRPLALGALVLTLFAAACGNSVETTGTGGNGGTGGAPTCPAEPLPCCEPGQSDPCCAQCNPTTKVCGTFGSEPCAPDEYCDFTDDQCGSAGPGVCVKKPLGCDGNFEPTCGCDGAIHGNVCEAASAGADVSNLGGCKPPPGTFGCGAKFCTLGAEYCEDFYSDVGGEPPTFTCKLLPEPCAPMPGCACLADVLCGFNCAVTGDGGLKVSCGGG